MSVEFGQSQYKDINHYVKHLLMTDLECSLNRNLLIAKFWNEVDKIGLTEKQIRQISKATPAESITRYVRAKNGRRIS